MQPAILTYITLRLLLGWLGLALPPALLLAAWLTDTGLQPSISEYFYTPARDILEGTLVSMSAFLFSYQGYHSKASDRAWLTDRRVAAVAGSGALGVAAIPISAPGSTACSFFSCLLTRHHVPIAVIDGLHLFSAALFFGATAVFALVNFQRGNPKDPKNVVKYPVLTICGWVIIGCLVLLTARKMISLWLPALDGILGWPGVVFWLESLAIWAFAFAWLVKGDALKSVLRIIARHPRPRPTSQGPAAPAVSAPANRGRPGDD